MSLLPGSEIRGDGVEDGYFVLQVPGLAAVGVQLQAGFALHPVMSLYVEHANGGVSVGRGGP